MLNFSHQNPDFLRSITSFPFLASKKANLPNVVILHCSHFSSGSSDICLKRSTYANILGACSLQVWKTNVSRPPVTTQFHYRPQRSWAKVIFLHLSVILLRGVSPIFWGGLQFGGGYSPIFRGVLQIFFSFFFNFFPPKNSFWDAPPRDGQCAAGTHPTAMHSCYYCDKCLCKGGPDGMKERHRKYHKHNTNLTCGSVCIPQ